MSAIERKQQLSIPRLNNTDLSSTLPLVNPKQQTKSTVKKRLINDSSASF